MNKIAYVHGYSERETIRLADQAGSLRELLHHDTVYPPGSKILEGGCGTGVQTITLARQNPGCEIISIDISQDSLRQARSLIEKETIANVAFRQADIFALPFTEESFDHVFVCFVLEHLPSPAEALYCLKKVLKAAGSMTVIEGDHGSWYCYPESREARLCVECLIKVQANLGGNALVGRQLYPLLRETDFRNVSVSPRMVYVDTSKPGLVESFSKNTFIAMVEGVKEQALGFGMIDEKTWQKGIRDLYRATEEDGTFSYTFYKGVGIK